MGRAPLQFQTKDEAGPRPVHVYFLAELSMSHPANKREAYSPQDFSRPVLEACKDNLWLR